MKLARLQISRELFLAAIPLPEDTLILSARMVDHGRLELEVEHRDLREVSLGEGERPPLVAPVFEAGPDGPAFREWGQHEGPLDDGSD